MHYIYDDLIYIIYEDDSDFCTGIFECVDDKLIIE